MPKYVIERELRGAGKLSGEELAAIAENSNQVIHDMMPAVQWQQSYVTDEKIFCVYLADNPELLREHARRGGFPASAIHG